MSTFDPEQPEQPKPQTHPTIYMVHLGVHESRLFESNLAYRTSMIRRWEHNARRVGKKTVEVNGRYSQLGTFDVAPPKAMWVRA
jgi:hypothetical protein